MTNFCLVGFGSHSSRKIFPALKNSINPLKYIVSSKKLNFKNIKIFKNLEIAVSKVEKDTVFILSTPPNVHEKQIQYLIQNKFNVIVEKPAYIKLESYLLIHNIKKLGDNFIFENFMYQYSYGYEIVNSIIKNFKNDILTININFLLPSYPANTFRENSSIKLSTIHDIGCYITSFFVSSKIKILACELSNKINFNDIPQKLSFKFKSKKFKIFANVGKSIRYKNEIIFTLNNEIKLKLNYFFYGVEKQKCLSIYHKDKFIKKIFFKDNNQFSYLFNQPKEFFFKNQFSHSANLEQIRLLELISEAYDRSLTI